MTATPAMAASARARSLSLACAGAAVRPVTATEAAMMREMNLPDIGVDPFDGAVICMGPLWARRAKSGNNALVLSDNIRFAARVILLSDPRFVIVAA